MNARLDALYLELLELARAQRAALEKGKVEEALMLLEERQGIVDEIQIIDAPIRLAEGIEGILSVDSDILVLLRKELGSVNKKLEAICKFKALCRDVHPLSRKGEMELIV
jgi:hypothetical protein